MDRTLVSMAVVAGLSWLALRNRQRAPFMAAPLVMLAILTLVPCGGSSSHYNQGTPPGTHMATVTAGTVNHNLPLNVTVQ